MRRDPWLEALRARDPLFADLVEDFFAQGGTLIRVPFGVSGRAAFLREFRDCATAYGRAGWLKRFGLRGVPDDVRPHVLDGSVPLHVARAPVVWSTLNRADGGAAHLKGVAIELELRVEMVESAVDVLLRHQRAVTVPAPRRPRYRAIGARPDWRDLLTPTERRAA